MLDKNKHLLQFSRCASLSYKAYLLFIDCFTTNRAHSFIRTTCLIGQFFFCDIKNKKWRAYFSFLICNMNVWANFLFPVITLWASKTQIAPPMSV